MELVSRPLFLLPVLALLGAPLPAAADIFRHQDEKGVVHFTNVPGNSNFQLYIKEYTKPQTPKAGKGHSKPLSSSHYDLNYLPHLTSHIDEASQQYGLDPKLIQAVIHVESNFDPLAVSPKGAQGLMQLMPQTAKDLQVSDVFSPKENIHGGSRYLRYLMDIYNQDMVMALAAYNAGPEKVNLHRGIPPYQETRTYVQRVLQIYNRLKTSLVLSR
jgi:soluble lytic murein transglycosylase-like protein